MIKSPLLYAINYLLWIKNKFLSTNLKRKINQKNYVATLLICNIVHNKKNKNMKSTIFNHRSIRKYQEKVVANSDLREILEAAIRASNTGNMQVYSIVSTKDTAIKKRLWESHFKQEMVNQAPVVLTFCADINRFNKWCDLNKAEPAYDNFLWLYNATIDATIAAQNAALAAEEKGLGICYLGTTTYMSRNIIDILKLPKGVVPVTTLVIGYADETPDLTDRLPFEAVVHEETYQDYTDAKIEDLFYDKDHSELTKKLLIENETETLAQVFTEKRYLVYRK